MMLNGDSPRAYSGSTSGTIAIGSNSPTGPAISCPALISSQRGKCKLSSLLRPSVSQPNKPDQKTGSRNVV
jgi:hypothetical protein